MSTFPLTAHYTIKALGSLASPREGEERRSDKKDGSPSDNVFTFAYFAESWRFFHSFPAFLRDLFSLDLGIGRMSVPQRKNGGNARLEVLALLSVYFRAKRETARVVNFETL